jgi:CBS domain-containing protein
MQLREIMTAGVVTADEGDEILKVARLMRDRGVGSVVITDPEVAHRMTAEGIEGALPDFYFHERG